jgi:hypothetical protein
MASSSAGKTGSLLVLLLGLGGVLGWNYHRNVESEAAEVRPYRSYSDAELDQLIDAYGSETDRHRAIYESSRRNVAVRDRGLLGEQIGEFERVQKISTQRRALASNVTKNQVSMSLLEEERAKRQLDRPVYKKIFRLLFTFR